MLVLISIIVILICPINCVLPTGSSVRVTPRDWSRGRPRPHNLSASSTQVSHGQV